MTIFMGTIGSCIYYGLAILDTAQCDPILIQVFFISRYEFVMISKIINVPNMLAVLILKGF